MYNMGCLYSGPGLAFRQLPRESQAAGGKRYRQNALKSATQKIRSTSFAQSMRARHGGGKKSPGSSAYAGWQFEWRRGKAPRF